MENAPLHRSYLFVPATRTERVAKAFAAGADAVIVDLEDAVAPADKAAAREAAARGLASGAGSILVRVNSPETQWFEEDLKLCAALGVGGVVLAKAERVDHVRHAVSRLKAPAPILPLIETARGYSALAALCEAPQVRRLVFGTLDFQLDLRIDGEGEELSCFRSGLVLASRVAGIQPPVDGVTVEIEDVERVRSDTARCRRWGFGGKLCIHPRQVPVVNECFRPGADAIAWARRIVAAAQAARGAAISVDGRMVDRPVILKAEEILGEAAKTRY
ncbi:MAG: CoA ester lyase [Burkholderiales bacterium]|nr:CoA ester lyase [Burkholderiales bacterium]